MLRYNTAMNSSGQAVKGSYLLHFVFWFSAVSHYPTRSLSLWSYLFSLLFLGSPLFWTSELHLLLKLLTETCVPGPAIRYHADLKRKNKPRILNGCNPPHVSDPGELHPFLKAPKCHQTKSKKNPTVLEGAHSCVSREEHRCVLLFTLTDAFNPPSHPFSGPPLSRSLTARMLHHHSHDFIYSVRSFRGRIKRRERLVRSIWD